MADEGWCSRFRRPTSASPRVHGAFSFDDEHAAQRSARGDIRRAPSRFGLIAAASDARGARSGIQSRLGDDAVTVLQHRSWYGFRIPDQAGSAGRPMRSFRFRRASISTIICGETSGNTVVLAGRAA